MEKKARNSDCSIWDYSRPVFVDDAIVKFHRRLSHAKQICYTVMCIHSFSVCPLSSPLSSPTLSHPPPPPTPTPHTYHIPNFKLCLDPKTSETNCLSDSSFTLLGRCTMSRRNTEPATASYSTASLCGIDKRSLSITHSPHIYNNTITNNKQ